MFVPPALLYAASGEFGELAVHVLDMEAQVMQTLAMLIKVGAQWMIGSQGFDELKMDVAQVKMRQAHSDAIQDFGQHDGQTECLMIKLERFTGIADNYRHVIEFPRHSRNLAGLDSNHKPTPPLTERVSRLCEPRSRHRK